MKILPLLLKVTKQPYAQVIHQTKDYQEYTNGIIFIRDCRLTSDIEGFIDIKELRVYKEMIRYPNMDNFTNTSRYPEPFTPVTEVVDSKAILSWKRQMSDDEFKDSVELYIELDYLKQLAKTYDPNLLALNRWRTNISHSSIAYFSDELVMIIAPRRLERK